MQPHSKEGQQHPRLQKEKSVSRLREMILLLSISGSISREASSGLPSTRDGATGENPVNSQEN